MKWCLKNQRALRDYQRQSTPRGCSFGSDGQMQGTECGERREAGQSRSASEASLLSRKRKEGGSDRRQVKAGVSATGNWMPSPPSNHAEELPPYLSFRDWTAWNLFR